MNINFNFEYPQLTDSELEQFKSKVEGLLDDGDTVVVKRKRNTVDCQFNLNDSNNEDVFHLGILVADIRSLFK